MHTPAELRAMTHEQLVKYAVRLQEQVAHKEAVIKQRAAEAKERATK